MNQHGRGGRWESSRGRAAAWALGLRGVARPGAALRGAGFAGLRPRPRAIRVEPRVSAVRALLGLWVVWIVALLPGCDAGPKPGLEVQVVVIGDAAAGERVRRIDVVFDRGMVAGEALGTPLALGEGVPFRLEPAVAGSLRWREDRRLSFEPDEALPRATAFVAVVPQGTRAPDDVGLTADYEHRFETQRLSLTSELVRDFRLPDPASWATSEQRVKLSFNQPVAPEQVSAHCRYRSKKGDRQVALEPLAGEPRQQLEVGPSERLPMGASLRFACDPTLTGAEGPLPLAGGEPTGQARGGAPSGALDFRTYGAFRAVSASPSGEAVSPDEGTVSVHFSTPPGQVGQSPIRLEPAPRALGSYAWVEGAALSARVSGLEPHTDYEISLAGELQDAFGQSLRGPFRARFRTGPAAPRYSLETGSWAVEASRGGYVGWTRNVSGVEVIAASLTERQLFDVLPTLDWWDREAVDLVAAQVPFQSRVLRPAGKRDAWTQLELRPQELLGAAAKASRFYYLATRSPDVFDRYETDADGKPLPQGYQEVLLNVTDLGLTTKLSGNSGLVWVTRLSSGAAVSGAEVSVRERSGALLWRGTTGSDGVVTMPGRSALLERLRADHPGAAAPAEEEAGRNGSRLLVFARRGGDATFVDPDQPGRFAPWSFGVQSEDVPREHALRGFLHTDRGLYRPGDTVHLRGLARFLRLGGSLFVPEAKEVEVILSDPRGRELLRAKSPLSRFGGFHFDYPVPQVAPLGDYRVRARLPHGEFSTTFQVEEYRPATFEVELESAQKEAFAGQSLSLSSSGRYFYGAPVRSAAVTLRVHARPREVRFPGYEEYSFVHRETAYESVRPYGEEAFLTEQRGKLDAAGRLQHEVLLPPERFVAPSTLLISASVQDETNQTVSKSLALPLHRTRLYLGVDTGGWVMEEQRPSPLSFIALDPSGRPVAAAASYRVDKQSWSCAWERWGYRGSYRCTPRVERVADGSLALSPQGAARESVVYPSPGEYLVTVEGVDRNALPVQASRRVWVYGSGESAWRADDSSRFDIIADRAQYAVGDTAKLILQAPTEGAQALVTVERDGVISRRLLPALRAGQALDVPITEAFAPNAYVSVLLSRGRSGEGARGLPTQRMGLINLPVPPAGKRLQVRVTTEEAEYRPGGSVKASLRVTDEAGAPVVAEVALAAADEGVLSLIGFRTPDPLATFFAPWGWAVRTASQYERLTQVPGPDQERYVTGGDGPGAPGSFRSRFRATAYWNPAVRTDEQGRAEVTFPAPDDLTAFRLMAVAADAADRFGSGERRFLVNKPVQLISALPRFASVGDRFEAAALLTNDTARPGTARVTLALEGPLAAEGQTAPLERQMVVPAGGRARVGFPVLASGAGEATLRFSVALGEHRDGLLAKLPVAQPAPPESELSSEGATEESVKVAVRFPEGVLPGSARLSVSVDPDGLAGVEEGLRDLVQYPYGCLEQTVSRLIPLVAVQELTRSLKLAEIDGEKLERYVRVAIAKVLRHQRPRGGFGLWPGSAPSAYLTAYALWGLKLARDAGYEVDEAAIQRGIDSLRRELASEPAPGRRESLAGELGSRAFALHVMSLLGRPDASAATALAATADALPRFGQAFLARALAAAVGPAHASVAALLDRLVSAPRGSGVAELIAEPRGAELDWYFSSHVRTSAIATDALLALRPEDPRLPGLIRGLLEERRGSGSWYTTQDSLYALVALSHYARARAGQGARVQLARGEEVLLDEALSGEGLGRIRRLELPVDPADARPLTVTAREGTVHYRVRLHYRRDADHQRSRSEGLELVRALLDPDTGAALDRVEEGRIVRVRLTLSTQAEQRYVALSDWLPAGLEPVDSRFVTVPKNLTPDDPDWRSRLWVTHRELSDDRVDAFVDWLPARPGNFEYLARATTVGRFVVPAATAEKMYDPDVRARTALGTFEVVARP